MQHISHHDTHAEFIQALRLIREKTSRGICVVDVEDISEEVAMAMDMYRNEFYEVNVIREQYDFMFTIDDRKYHPQGEPYVCFVSPGQLQSYEVLGDEERTRGYLMYVSKHVLRSINLPAGSPLFKRGEDNYHPLSMEQWDVLFDLLSEMKRIAEMPSPRTEAILQSYLQVVLLRCLDFVESQADSQNAYAQRTVAQFESLVNRQFVTHRSVAFYARELALSTRQLNYYTRQVLGKSPLQVIHDVLLNEAKALLSHSALSTTEVAHTLGFEEAGHFTRFFKRHTQLAPSAFREMVETGN